MKSRNSVFYLSTFLKLLLLITLACRASAETSANNSNNNSNTSNNDKNELTCSISEEQHRTRDPALQELTYDLGEGPQTMLAYVTPDVTSFYAPGTTPPAKTPVKPKFKGFSAKFINMSNQKVRLYWQLSLDSTSTSLMRAVGPFSATGTSSFPGHHFFFSLDSQPDQILQRFRIFPYPENIYFYDPYLVPDDSEATSLNLKQQLTPDELILYQEWNRTRHFDAIYRNFTQRSYLPRYLRPPPIHYLWPADYFGQQHWITTKETHFTSMPPPDQLETINHYGSSRILTDAQPRLLSEYRDPSQQVMNLTLTVLSCAPRVFEIQNFLSQTEVDHILHIAGGVTLQESGVGDGSSGDSPDAEEVDKRKTRTSYNSWVAREASPMIDAIYRRAADLLRIDEALLRHRSEGEHPDMPFKSTMAEHLQLVHYDLTQQYTAHHDFGYREMVDGQQPERFATLLLYLNEGMKGGETSFPRWINAETFEQYKVAPQVGKAVLFYSQLPDGNFDDFSQHAALPVEEGEKWLINLWVWDPVYGA